MLRLEFVRPVHILRIRKPRIAESNDDLNVWGILMDLGAPPRDLKTLPA